MVYKEDKKFRKKLRRRQGSYQEKALLASEKSEVILYSKSGFLFTAN